MGENSLGHRFVLFAIRPKGTSLPNKNVGSGRVHISLNEIAYVLNCGKKLIHDCVRKIFASVFREVDLNDVCCRNLGYLGKRCLDTTIKGLLSMPMFHKYSTKTLPRSEAVWNHCALIA
ncbi:hypothetical protein L1049_019328 [Liquidambar formosana]|uniref:Prolamin-like domain-containing protein n=1 Tax=Liquidambar formosana TaxID=63359 RepID=A0AAP0X6F9_LIQFO